MSGLGDVLGGLQVIENSGSIINLFATHSMSGQFRRGTQLLRIALYIVTSCRRMDPYDKERLLLLYDEYLAALRAKEPLLRFPKCLSPTALREIHMLVQRIEVLRNNAETTSDATQRRLEGEKLRKALGFSGTRAGTVISPTVDFSVATATRMVASHPDGRGIMHQLFFPTTNNPHSIARIGAPGVNDSSPDECYAADDDEPHPTAGITTVSDEDADSSDGVSIILLPEDESSIKLKTIAGSIDQREQPNRGED